MNKPYIYISAILLAIGLGYLLRGCTIKHNLGSIKDSIDANNNRIAFIDGQKQRDSLQLVALSDSIAKQDSITDYLRHQVALAKAKPATIKKPIVDSAGVAKFLSDFGKENQ